MRNVYLYGVLAEKYGPHFRFEVDTVGEAIRALQANFKTFFGDLRSGSFHVVRGDTLLDGDPVSEEQLKLFLGKSDLHICPLISGASGGGKGIITAVLGIALIATASILSGGIAAGSLSGFGAAMKGTALSFGIGSITWGNIAMFGGILALSGISQLLSPMPNVGDYGDREDKKQNFLMNGSINRYEQGGAIPVVYGKVRVGSIVVSSGLDVRDTSDDEDGGSTSYQIISALSPEYTHMGALVPSGIIAVKSGGSVTVKIVPEPTCSISDVLVDSVSVGSVTEYTFTNVDSSHRITATFTGGESPSYGYEMPS